MREFTWLNKKLPPQQKSRGRAGLIAAISQSIMIYTLFSLIQ